MIMVVEGSTYEAGNPGMNRVAFLPSLVKHCWVAGSGSLSPTPPSPEENIKETPRAPVTTENGLCIKARM